MNSKQYPLLVEALKAIAHDMGACNRLEYDATMSEIENMPLKKCAGEAEQFLAGLTEAERETFAIGDEAEAEKFSDKTGYEAAAAILNAYIEGEE